MANEVRIRVTAEDKTKGTLAGIKTNMAVVATGAAALGAAVIKGVGYAVNQASDLNETINKSSVIFGKAQPIITKFANSAAKDLGLSKQAAMEAAASMGDMFLQLGFAGKEATRMSLNVVRLSADLGSFNNLPTADVQERIAAAFRGEYDSLQQLIPNINAARVQQEAMSMTGKKNAESLTAQEKAAATMSIIMKDSERAQGDFAKTSGGLANSLKINKARIDDLAASFGKKLLPVAQDASKEFGKVLDVLEGKGKIKGSKNFEEFFKTVKEAADEFLPPVKTEWHKILKEAKKTADTIKDSIDSDIIPAMGRLVDATTPASESVSDSMKVIRVAIKLVGADSKRNFHTMAGIIDNVAVPATKVLAKAYRWMRGNIGEAMADMRANTGTRLHQIEDRFHEFVGNIKNRFPGAGTMLKKIGKAIIQGLWDGMKSVFDPLKKWVSGIAGWIKAHKGPVSADRQLLVPAGKALMEGLLGGLKFGFKGVGDFVYKIGSKVSDVIGKIKDSMFGGFGKLATGGYRTLGRLMAAAYGWRGAQWNALNALWTRESGWNPRARNPSSGAFGIPQALPASKMGALAVSGNAAAQIAWGLRYIRGRYGSPLNAWAHSQKTGWYDQGGILPSGGVALNASGRPERVLSPAMTRSFDRMVSVMERGNSRGAVTVNQYFSLPNYVGSHSDLTRALVKLKSQGRLDVITR